MMTSSKIQGGKQGGGGRTSSTLYTKKDEME